MTPTAMIDALQVVPYVPDNGDWSGADCWGVIELWYKHVLGINLEDRADHPAGHGGLQAGFDAAETWEPIEAPVDHCLVIMRGHGFEAGHVGIFYDGHVLHSDKNPGCIYQPIEHRYIRTRITKFLKHVSL